MAVFITTNGISQEMPDPLCRAAIVVGPPREGIQKKPSVNSPLDKSIGLSAKKVLYIEVYPSMLSKDNEIAVIFVTSFATLERA